MTIRRTLAAALAASAIAAPAAGAMPAPPDMHSSTAQAAAQERRAQGQDLRGEAARDAALHPRKATAVDARGATAADSQSKSTPVAPGQPTWAVNPKPLPPPTQAASTTSSDDGVDWATIGIGVGITLLVLGGIVALTNRSRSLPRTRASV
jgi:hypothetical protein